MPTIWQLTDDVLLNEPLTQAMRFDISITGECEKNWSRFKT